jgi:hypothetical protein
VLSFETHNHDHKAEIDRIEGNPLPPKQKKQKSQKKLSEKLKEKKNNERKI